jgi:Arc/MetJ-type ribon-helix-helix transcriptional regulator
MTTPVPTRFSDEELELIDELVREGVAENRSAVIRRGIHHLADSVRRARLGATIASSYRDLPQSDEDNDLALASAIAMTEAEPW